MQKLLIMALSAHIRLTTPYDHQLTIGFREAKDDANCGS